MPSHVAANGISFNYRFDGPPNRPVVMLGNSLMSDLSMWEPQVAALTERFRVLRYDTRGHGSTDAPAGAYTIGLLASDAVALLDALGLERVHFVGLSLGGMTGQFLGARHGDRLLGLVLCDTASDMPTPEMWDGRIRTAETQGIEALVPATLERWFTAPFRERRTDAIERVRAMIRRTPVQGYVGCCHAIRDMHQTEMLADIKAPTLVIVGADDPSTPVAAARAIHERIPGSELKVIEDAAHLPNIEQPEAFNAALLAFLERVERGR